MAAGNGKSRGATATVSVGEPVFLPLIQPLVDVQSGFPLLSEGMLSFRVV